MTAGTMDTEEAQKRNRLNVKRNKVNVNNRRERKKNALTGVSAQKNERGWRDGGKCGGYYPAKRKNLNYRGYGIRYIDISKKGEKNARGVSSGEKRY